MSESHFQWTAGQQGLQGERNLLILFDVLFLRVKGSEPETETRRCLLAIKKD